MDIEWNEIARFFVHGIPKPQPRPRARVMYINRKPVPQIYNPKDTDGWKDAVKFYAGRHKPAEPRTDSLRVDIQFHMPRPKRLMRKCDPEGVMLYDGPADRDNLDKAVLDAMTDCGWWVDDRQVVGGELLKLYAAKSGPVGAWVVVSELVKAQEQADLFAETAA